MKLAHLADLHLGKRLYEFSLLEDQRFILEQIQNILEEEKVDGVLVAGDVYDKPVPAAEAVGLLDSFLTGVARRGIKVFLISGNHDSAERLAFGARLFGEAGVYVSGLYEGFVRSFTLRDEYGEADIFLLPFLKPSTVQRFWPEEKIETYQDAVRTALRHTEPDPSRRSVLVAHQFVTGAGTCESEELQVGGLDQVDASLFEGFDYVALGHLHSPQKVGRETLRYCGTPLKYSFSEADQVKSLTLVELREKGEVRVSVRPLRPLRDLRRIRGSYMEVTSPEYYEKGNREDYVQVTLTDEEDVLDGMQKLRFYYPNLMSLQYDNLRTRQAGEPVLDGEPEKKSELELFEEFYESQNNQPMKEEQKGLVRDLIGRLTGETGE